MLYKATRSLRETGNLAPRMTPESLQTKKKRLFKSTGVLTEYFLPPDSGYKLVVDGPYGALGGNSFTDNDVSSAGKVTKIEFSLTKRLGGAAGFRFTYGNTPGTFHGNSGRGGIHEVVLDADEKIIGLKGKCGKS